MVGLLEQENQRARVEIGEVEPRKVKQQQVTPQQGTLPQEKVQEQMWPRKRERERAPGVLRVGTTRPPQMNQAARMNAPLASHLAQPYDLCLSSGCHLHAQVLLHEPAKGIACLIDVSNDLVVILKVDTGVKAGRESGDLTKMSERSSGHSSDIPTTQKNSRATAPQTTHCDWWQPSRDEDQGGPSG